MLLYNYIYNCCLYTISITYLYKQSITVSRMEVFVIREFYICRSRINDFYKLYFQTSKFYEHLEMNH